MVVDGGGRSSGSVSGELEMVAGFHLMGHAGIGYVNLCAGKGCVMVLRRRN
jgi:hypothetical protein